jgi:3-hydroxyisobutyrate dehydrogenase-like beta-hydroxyacid dehydrogenase
MTAVGFVGLGAMGSRVTARLLGAGNEVYGTNRTRDKAQPLIERGMKWLDTPREVAAAADVSFSMVTDDEALKAISDGPDGILAGLGPGKLHVDMSTVSPTASRDLAARVKTTRAAMVDAPVSGSIPQAEAGTLTIMVGGDDASFATAEPLLKELGQTVTHVGPNGNGLLVKLAINISLAVQTLAFSEGVLLAERGGVKRETAAKVLSESAIGSPMLKARVPLFLNLPAEAWFDISMMHKDIRLACQTSHEEQARAPSAALADGILGEAEQLGYAHRDIASILEVLERTSGSDHPA